MPSWLSGKKVSVEGAADPSPGPFLQRAERFGQKSRTVRDEVVATHEAIRKLLTFLPTPTRQSTISYEDVVRWFVVHRAKSPQAAQGALLRSPQPDGRIELIQVLLDREGAVLSAAPPDNLARRMMVDALDDELAQAFGDSPLLLVK